MGQREASVALGPGGPWAMGQREASVALGPGGPWAMDHREDLEARGQWVKGKHLWPWGLQATDASL